mgnify:CR=1 FL=1
MKKQIHSGRIWKSVLSFLVFILFVIIAIGSIDEFINGLPDTYTDDLGNGIYKETTIFSDGDRVITTGPRDKKYGEFNGRVTIRWDLDFPSTDYSIEVNMVDGEKDGTAIYTFDDGETYKKCYTMGKQIPCGESSSKKYGTQATAFNIFSMKQSYTFAALNGFGFDTVYIQHFLDTIETLLNEFTFSPEEFDDNYGDVMNTLEETPYDSIIEVNLSLSYVKGVERQKKSELRKASIDFHWEEGSSTFNILETRYPNYLLAMNNEGVSNDDFEVFCYKLDSIMEDFGTLDHEDAFFTDSIDTRLTRAILIIMEEDETSLSMHPFNSLKAAAMNTNPVKLISRQNIAGEKTSSEEYSPSEVAELVVLQMFFDYDLGDVIKYSVQEAYFKEHGERVAPTITTSLKGVTANSANLDGYVIDDGGAAITARGITWATFHNPTVSDNIEFMGEGIGNYSVIVSGLNEGETYYARSFAFRSMDTTYGNCIEFVAEETLGFDENKQNNLVQLYPIPSTGIVYLVLGKDLCLNTNLSITDLGGHQVYYANLGSVAYKGNIFTLDLAHLEDGIYVCKLIKDKRVVSSTQLIIAR